MKDVSFILWKTLNRLFGQPNILNVLHLALKLFNIYREIEDYPTSLKVLEQYRNNLIVYF